MLKVSNLMLLFKNSFGMPSLLLLACWPFIFKQCPERPEVTCGLEGGHQGS